MIAQSLEGACPVLLRIHVADSRAHGVTVSHSSVDLTSRHRCLPSPR